MKITGVVVTVFREAPTEAGALHSLVELRGDSPLSGIAIARGDLRTQVTRMVDSLLVGEDPRAVVGLWQRMQDAAAASEGSSALSAAIAVVDVALWDLKAKINGEPLWQALGGSRPKANAHARGIAAASSEAEFVRECALLAGRFGFRALTMPAGADRDADLRRLQIAFQALKQGSDDPVLALDFQARLTPKESIRALREYEERYDVSWVREPAAARDFLGLKQVSDGVRAAVCAGRNLAAVADLLPHFQHHALDVVEISLASAGITGALQLADCAFGFELPVILSATAGNVHAHLASVMPYFTSLEVREPAAAGLFQSDVSIVEGWAVVGDSPGTGLRIDRAALAAAAARAGPSEKLTAA